MALALEEDSTGVWMNLGSVALHKAGTGYTLYNP